MELDELKKEAEEWRKNYLGENTGCMFIGKASLTDAYLASAEPREKRIEELEKNVDYYAKRAKSAESHIIRQNERIAHLEKEIAELKEQLWSAKPTCNNCGHCDCENYQMQRKSEPCALWISHKDQLTKAKELLLELYDCIPSSMADSCKETLQKVALFFKDSEVE